MQRSKVLDSFTGRMEGCILGNGKVGSKTEGEFLRGKMEYKELVFGVMGRK